MVTQYLSIPLTGVKLFIGSKDQCMFCFEICTPEGRGGEKGGRANFKIKQYTDPLTQEIPSALYIVIFRQLVLLVKLLSLPSNMVNFHVSITIQTKHNLVMCFNKVYRVISK